MGMIWIYLSPHLDDIVLSCGGLVWEQTRQGVPIQIWTVCAGDPPPGPFSPYAQSLHARWGLESAATATRRSEDIASCALLGAEHRHLPFPDCIYRYSPITGEALYTSDEAIFGTLHTEDASLVAELSSFLEQNLPADAEVVCPLTLGSHVDHQLTRMVAQKLGRSLWFYADYPYAENQPADTSGLIPEDAELVVFPVSQAGLEVWIRGVAEHHSQISTFWSGPEAMDVAIRDYYRRNGGVRLWRSRS